MKSKQALVITVVLSLALNLLLVGMMLGRMAGPMPEMRRVDPVIGMRRLISELPEQRAEALAPLYREYFAAIRPRFREIRRSQAELRSAMLSEPLDTAALRAALGAFQTQLFESQSEAHDAFVTLAAELTLAEREQLVALMGQRPAFERPHGARFGGPPIADPSRQGRPGPPPP